VSIQHLQGRISKYVTNGSKTAVMDVISFLWVSVSRSTIQLRGSLGSKGVCAYSKADFGSQIADRVEECTTKNKRSVICFLFWAKGLNAKAIQKEMFLFTVGSQCRGRVNSHIACSAPTVHRPCADCVLCCHHSHTACCAPTLCRLCSAATIHT
jgi:hypothetical protein